MREHHPVFFRHEFGEVILDLFGRFTVREPEPLRNPRYMRINHNAGCDTECIAHYDVRGFSCHAAKR